MGGYLKKSIRIGVGLAAVSLGVLLGLGVLEIPPQIAESRLQEIIMEKRKNNFSNVQNLSSMCVEDSPYPVTYNPESRQGEDLIYNGE